MEEKENGGDGWMKKRRGEA
ncbi:uncharacterized protein G2W53_001617 [Senna tora]|uniref:Uncharacterized protein n=1 Tax=Senna tora TaxID=362788 RepID=A0A835CMP6_9FABA|nr:uncharacterized protein G2W53_001617 [Senna tora]